MNQTFRKRDIIALMLIPMELIISQLLLKIPGYEKSEKLLLAVSLALPIGVFLIMISFYGDFLRSEWQRFKKHMWRNIFICLLLVLGVFAVLIGARAGLKDLAVDTGLLTKKSIYLSLLTAIIPMLAPFTEELIFRYILFGRVKIKIFKFLMFFVSSILFGLIHFNNFGGDLMLTIPYMCVGAYFALIYFVSKNIWFSISTHLIFNGINSILPAIFLVVMNLLGAV